MISLNWSGVSAWRLSQHALLQRASGDDLLEVVSRLGGIQAQIMSAAELALWARVEGISPDDVQDALWRERSLIKTWVMRGTLHLISAHDFPLYVSARAAVTIRRPPSYFTYHGVTPEELDAILEGIPQVLGETPVTREQLADALATRAGMPNLREVLLSGWGALLKPSAFRGDLCFGPNQGQNVTFVQPGKWLRSSQAAGDVQFMDPQEAFKEVARRYLNAYGPANPEDFARWWGLQNPGPAKKAFKSLGDEIEEVDVEGWKAWALTSALERLAGMKTPGTVRLLPLFDAYTVGISRQDSNLLAEEYRPRVYRPQGWISAAVLVDGRIEGTWETEQKGSRTLVTIEPFGKPHKQVNSGIEAEAQKLGDFLGTTVELDYKE